MIRPWKVTAQYLAKRRAAKARASLAEELFLEAAKRLIEENDWRTGRHSSRSTAAVLPPADPVRPEHGVSSKRDKIGDHRPIPCPTTSSSGWPSTPSR
jgi:hypothetical protein